MRFSRSFSARHSAGISCISFAVLGSPAVLAQSLPPPMLEEVVVTAQKRSESLQDVSIAVSVVSGEQIANADLKNLQELSSYVPNFYQIATPTSNVVYIRGLGSSPNAGFEQSVGTFKDGVYYGRARQTLAPLFDLARVEVLKGPQSILFGKNTSAGAVSITSAPAQSEFEGSVTLQGGTQNQRLLQGYVTGPVHDVVDARLAFYGSAQDGWVYNSFDDNDGPATRDYGARLNLAFAPTDALSGQFLLERTRGTVEGAPYEMTRTSQNVVRGELAPPTLTGLESELNYKNNFGNTQPLGDSVVSSEITMDTAMLQLDYALGDNTLTSITAYTGYAFDSNSDLDFTPSNLINATDGSEDFGQWSQELRLTSAGGGGFDYIAGVYLQYANLDINQPIGFQLSTVAPTNLLDGERTAVFEQVSKTASAFFQGSVDITQALRFKFGLRYTYESKDLDRDLSIASFDGVPISNPLALFLWESRLDTAPYTTSRSRSEDDWAPMVALEWDASDSIMTYLSATKGFKGGGYDSIHSNGNKLDTLEYEPETAYSVELGAKMSLWDSRAELNVALFNTRFYDLQVSTFDGVAGFNVGNAAQATTRGLEVDTRVLVTPNLILNASLAVLDYNYDEYDGAPCTNGQLAQQIVDSSSAPETGIYDGSAAGCINDLAGETVSQAPRYSATLGGIYTAQISNGLDLVLGVDALYRSEYFLAADLDPNLVQDAWWRINARIALAARDGRWELAVIGKNLNDAKTLSSGEDIPFGSTNTAVWNVPDFNGSYYGVISPPRSLAVQMRYNFF
jgi:outer membrane receptor protein involved in Fe transport